MILRYLDLEGASKDFPLDKPVTLGRSLDASIPLPNASVSRTHASISAQADGSLAIRDLDSSNGIYVNDRRIDRIASLTSGNHIQIGELHFVIEISPNPEIPTTLKAIPSPTAAAPAAEADPAASAPAAEPAAPASEAAPAPKAPDNSGRKKIVIKLK
jgi:pSer/pThr/pTyr-binding forkhead associated (FHA) protein